MYQSLGRGEPAGSGLSWVSVQSARLRVHIHFVQAGGRGGATALWVGHARALVCMSSSKCVLVRRRHESAMCVVAAGQVQHEVAACHLYLYMSM